MEALNNMALYEQARAVPEEAKKPISGGPLNGMTNINPMYRIKRLTEMFGPCGIGWWYEIAEQRLVPSFDGAMYCFVDIDLYYKVGEQTSHPIRGTGGSAFIASNTKGLKASDECYKMALTDALSVAAKALGVGADVYWDSDTTKYGVWMNPAQPVPQPMPMQTAVPMTAAQAFANMPQAQPVQAQMYTAQPAASVPQTAYMQACPQTAEEAMNIIVNIGNNAGKTLGEILNTPKGQQALLWLATKAPTSPEGIGAGLILKSLVM